MEVKEKASREETLTQIEFDEFILVSKRIIKENLSTNTVTLSAYRTQIKSNKFFFLLFLIFSVQN